MQIASQRQPKKYTQPLIARTSDILKYENNVTSYMKILYSTAGLLNPHNHKCQNQIFCHLIFLDVRHKLEQNSYTNFTNPRFQKRGDMKSVPFH